ncbi:hypothetical protein [Halorubellus sp. PRR65]|uniref:hypothetical protein n=1 Tax=Halorubellus sp. PRR65 TaxID=3098148 RepID=UPI002B26417F|nr:hypothetical protein [Halorubellus sp. PRR65]
MVDECWPRVQHPRVVQDDCPDVPCWHGKLRGGESFCVERPLDILLNRSIEVRCNVFGYLRYDGVVAGADVCRGKLSCEVGSVLQFGDVVDRILNLDVLATAFDCSIPVPPRIVIVRDIDVDIEDPQEERAGLAQNSFSD